jgi:hypothetical protein
MGEPESSAPVADTRAPLGADLIVPALAIAFTAYFFVSVHDLAWEAKATATIVGATLMALVALQLARVAARILSGRASLSLRALIRPYGINAKRIAIVVATGAFIFLIPWLGLTLGLFLLTAILMLLLREASLKATLATSAIVAGTAYGLFIALLNSRLPRGPVEKLLAALF